MGHDVSRGSSDSFPGGRVSLSDLSGKAKFRQVHGWQGLRFPGGSLPPAAEPQVSVAPFCARPQG